MVSLNGHDHYLGKHDSESSKSAYRRLIKEWESSGRGTTFGSQGQCTLAMLAVDYLEFCAGYYPESTNSETVQTQHSVKFLADYYDLPAADFGPLRLKAVRNAMLEFVSAKTRERLSRRYINRMIDRIRRMFRWGAENELVDVAVYQALSAVAGLKRGRTAAPEPPPVEPVQEDVLQATMEYCSPVIEAMVRLQVVSAMRPGEVCCLTPSMVDRSTDCWIASLPEHKCAWRGDDRQVFFGPQAKEILLPFLLRDGDEALFSPRESESWRNHQRGGRGNVSPRVNAQYTTQSYARAIKYAAEKAFPMPQDLTDDEVRDWKRKYYWSPNQLRHLAGTRVRERFGLEAAQVFLGHSKADVTQVYAVANMEKGRAVAEAIG